MIRLEKADVVHTSAIYRCRSLHMNMLGSWENSWNFTINLHFNFFKHLGKYLSIIISKTIIEWWILSVSQAILMLKHLRL